FLRSIAMPPFGQSVLIVDDDPYIQQVLKDRLELHYRVFVASTGREGLALLKDAGPQLVLLDMKLLPIGDMDGMEVLTAMRTQAPEVPVVMITAHGTIASAVQAMKEGACDFITKPFDFNLLTAIVQKAMELERLKSQVHVLSEDLKQQYYLVVGES